LFVHIAAQTLLHHGAIGVVSAAPNYPNGNPRLGALVSCTEMRPHIPETRSKPPALTAYCDSRLSLTKGCLMSHQSLRKDFESVDSLPTASSITLKVKLSKLSLYTVVVGANQKEPMTP